MLQSKEEIRLAIILGTMLLIILILIITVSVVLFRSRQEKHAKEKNRMQEEFSLNLLQAQMEIQEQTLRNISQEIHDNVGQVLSLAKLNLNTMDIGKTEQLTGKIDNTLTQVSKAINDLRDLSRSFNTDNIAAIGLMRAIEYEMEMIRKTGSYKTVFDIDGNTKKLEPQRELILFRIVQEVLHNIIKHASASSVSVMAVYSDKDLELKINDDGKGFNLSTLNEESQNGTGQGIRNMHNRARLIGADFSISSPVGKGTSVRIILPFDSNKITHPKKEEK